jgi:hypothetical protein
MIEGLFRCTAIFLFPDYQLDRVRPGAEFGIYN